MNETQTFPTIYPNPQHLIYWVAFEGFTTKEFQNITNEFSKWFDGQIHQVLDNNEKEHYHTYEQMSDVLLAMGKHLQYQHHHIEPILQAENADIVLSNVCALSIYMQIDPKQHKHAALMKLCEYHPDLLFVKIPEEPTYRDKLRRFVFDYPQTQHVLVNEDGSINFHEIYNHFKFRYEKRNESFLLKDYNLIKTR